ncbi:ThiF family adenylyltransferase [Alcaligenes aquatilis]|uniref:ThiF family adenylyltransferase n=1 Tax=Alcaligenes aquatilis TaxID=323284 RepID=A0ABY4NCV7_9BURK|nr:ThiF family adenylyltransferase [Alcaligenes aquatilis]UQN34890.1 ThiF family adenylyltransferase [Alcaligenes aquatilis]
MEEYYELVNVVEISDVAKLKISRARLLHDAVARHRDYTIVKLLQHSVENMPKVECLIVEVECDGVPPKNMVGIKYRERLALCVSDDPKRLVDVLALRKDFPVLMHQNQGALGMPASLCLYFEAPTAVYRTWTPQNFLRRIQWWLERSARGELHPADQPVEQLFFASKYELVLPWNMPALIADTTTRFILVRGPDRSGGGFTCFLDTVPKTAELPTGSIVPLELTLPPIVHGFIERDPATLGDLDDLLAKRGVELLPTLSASIEARVGEEGVAESADDRLTVILLHVPVCRAENAEPVSINHRAFVLLEGALVLGAAIGSLFKLDKRYYRAAGLMSDQAAEVTWRDTAVFPMSVLCMNDGAAARRQSGINDAGPDGVLVGVGSLGSAILNLWSRSGWGQWTIIDEDYIKPHNLTRHQAYTKHVGESKAKVLADLHGAITNGATIIRSLAADATNFEDQAVREALTSTQVVVDASTTIEYPRAASVADAFARHISVFITPSGNASVLLAEDAKRLIRLRTLEAQYYRAVIQQQWGETHLDGNGGSFWSGAGCRDISLVLPYSRITAHASTLAEQVSITIAQEDPAIRIWQRDPSYGTVDFHEVMVAAERCFALDGIKLYIDEGVEQQLRELRVKGLPNETGGILLGYYDFNINAIFIVAGLPAPPDSKCSPVAFERGIVGLAEDVAEASRRTAGIVGYIGEWHSHPPGHSAFPSRDDRIQLAHLALGMADDGLPAIQLIVSDCDLQVSQGVLRQLGDTKNCNVQQIQGT